MKKLFTKRMIFCAAVVIAIIIVPFLYSYFYLGAFWDPYSKLESLPVAVVNEDKGAAVNDIERNLGNEMCDTLKEDGSLKFIFTDAKTAKSGTEGTDYYATITIPENFSENIASASTENKQTATITYSPNEKRNYLASQILARAVLQIEEQTRSKINKEVVTQLSDKLKEAPDQMTELQDGLSKLGDGSSKLLDGTGTLTDGTQKLLDGTITLADGTKSLLDGSKTLANGTGALSEGTNQLAEGSKTLTAGTNTLLDGTKNYYSKFKEYTEGVASLKDGSAKLASGTESLQTGIDKVQAGTDQLVEKTNDIGQISTGAQKVADGNKALDAGIAQYTGGVDSLISNVNSTATFLTQFVKANPSLMKDPAFATFIKTLSDPSTATKIQSLKDASTQLKVASALLVQGSAQLSTGAQSLPALNEGLKTLSAGVTQVETGSAALSKGAKTLNSGVETLSAATDQLYSAAGDIADGANQVNSGATKLSSGAADLNSGAADLNSGANKLSDGAADLNSGAKDLSKGASDLNKGANDLNDGANELNNGIKTAKDGVDTSMTDTKEQLKSLDGIAEFAEKPVSVEEKDVTTISNYGTAFAPYFMSLSLWVGALILFVGIYLDTEGKFKIMSRVSNHRVARCFLFLAVGFGQAIALALVVKNGLGLKVDNVPLFYFSICLVSMVFIAMVQFFIVHLKSAGKLISIVMLILQLTSCGGTFPMETVPKMFNVMYPFMPMTYSVALFKQAITKTDYKAVAYNCGVLGAILIVFMALTIILSTVKARKASKAQVSMPIQFEN